MIEEPACNSGKLISLIPARGPEESKRKSLHTLDSFTAVRFNAPQGYTELVVKHLAKVTGLPCVPAENLIEATSDCGAYVMVHGALKRTDCGCTKVDFKEQLSGTF